MELLRPPVKSLVFQVYTRPLHPELFEVLSTQQVKKLGHDARVLLTSKGHVITWTSQGRFLTEVLSTTEAELPGNRWVDLKPHLGHAPVTKMLPTQLKLPGVTYQACFSSETVSDAVFFELHDEILADSRKRGLLCKMPTNCGLPALGFVILEGRPGCLLTHTFHTFPEERTVIKSQSLIETSTGPGLHPSQLY